MMRLFLFLVVVVACASLTSEHSKKSNQRSKCIRLEGKITLCLKGTVSDKKYLVEYCNKLAKRFIYCLKRRYKPKSFENCEEGNGILKNLAMVKSGKGENNVIATGCEIRDYKANPKKEQAPVMEQPLRKVVLKTENKNRNRNKTETETKKEPKEAGPNWCRHENSFLYSYAGTSYDTLEAAKEACLNNDQCNGITQVFT
jgi:hypothetical protein